MTAKRLNTTHYRVMEKSDLDQVMVIEEAVYPYPWSILIFNDCIKGKYYCRVLEEHEKIIGYSIISVAVEESHLLNVCVHPSKQSQGVGRLLMRHMVAEAKNKNAKSMFLEVRPSNTSAIALYKSFDFKQVGLRKAYYPSHSGREDALVYSREL